MAKKRKRDIAAESMTAAELRDEIELAQAEIQELDEQIEKYTRTKLQNQETLRELEDKKRPLAVEVKIMAVALVIGFAIGLVFFFFVH